MTFFLDFGLVKVVFSLLQYVDDTVIVGEATEENV